jgi:hypothetical protein
MKANVSEEYLSKLVTRLENAVLKLEGKSGTSQSDSSAQDVPVHAEEVKLSPIEEYWNKTLKNLEDFEASTTETNIPALVKIYEVVKEVICAHQDIIVNASSYKKPERKNMSSVTEKIIAITKALPDLSKANRDVALHCDAVKNGLDSVFWIMADAQCDQITQTYLEAIDFAGNKIMMKKNPPETKWIKSFKAIIKEIDTLVKGNFKFGPTWNESGDEDITKLSATVGTTLKNLANAPVKEVKRGRRETLSKKGKQEAFDEKLHIYTFDNLENETVDVNPEKLEEKTFIIINNSKDSTYKISKKIKSIKLTHCEGVNIICESLIVSFEIINCVGTKVQVNDLVNSFSIDGSNGVLLHLHENSKDAKIIASKSNDMRIRLTKDGDMGKWDEIKLPEQFVYTIGGDRKVNVGIN